ncbi:MAG TPA: hypothetical protein PLQ13_11145, partial [Candidatus Krumholzibacteria bacterium]|nr:hypothetical protein [Candidatus Krumholzibacteria bacterium]
MPKSVLLALLGLALGACPASAATPAEDFPVTSVLAVDGVGRLPGLPPAADVLAVELRREASSGRPVLRISFLSLATDGPGAIGAAAKAAGPRPVDLVVTELDGARRTLASTTLVRDGAAWRLDAMASDKAAAGAAWMRDDDPDAVYLALPADALTAGAARFAVSADAGGIADRLTVAYPADKAYFANCALVLHGNQGLGYSDVFHGRSDDLEGSGVDEAVQVHQATGVPGNFHLSGPLQSSA